MKSLHPFPDNCTGCRLCVTSCSFFHHQTFAEFQARLRIAADETIWKFEPVVCRQCEDAECVAACPTMALSRDPETGAVLLDASACSGCEACRLACPYEAIVMDRASGTAQICDLCHGNPSCAAACPHSAIVYSDQDTVASAVMWFGEPLLK